MSETPDEPVLLRIHLRGGQTIEKVVTDWKVLKSNVTGELLEFTWTGMDGERMPYLRADAVDAVTRHPVDAAAPEISR